jgi:7-cyano-7-deazaguanine synthase
MAISQGFEPCALSFFYHQRHKVEMEAARRVAEKMGVVRRLVLELPLHRIGGSALTDTFDVPKHEDAAEIPDGIPITYVPARNTIFLSFALGWAEVLGAADIFIGVNALDYSGYPDCRPEYIESFEKTANLALKEAVEGKLRMRVHTPLIKLTKAEIIRKGLALGVDYSLTHSCYDPSADGRPCGKCDSCLLRKKGFHEAGYDDPAQYPQTSLR